jgi:toxin FitB
MSGFLLDTNVVSEAVQLRPEPNVVEWLAAIDESILHLSVLTVGEIRKGVEGLPSSQRRARLEAWLEKDLAARFAGRILPITVEVADRWGTLAAGARRRGRPLAIIDGLLAATAIHHNLTVVTRNEADFRGLPLAVLNPWQA